MSEPSEENKRPRRLTFVIPDHAYWDYRREADRLDLSITNYFLSLWAASGIGEKCLCNWTYSVMSNNGEKLVVLVDLMSGRLSLEADIQYVFRDLCEKMDVDDQTFVVFQQADGRYAEITFNEKGFVKYASAYEAISYEEIIRTFFQRAELPVDPVAQSDPS
ncbi:hypothetical protein [Pseudomonas putida]|uniref:hypothetical protein n=1 Tax=Pseudomonas putida TaxID=303 RepID=UPI003D99D329